MPSTTHRNSNRPLAVVPSDALRPALPPPQDLERLGDQIAELAAHLDAATYRLLVLIREFDAREGWHLGFRTCAHWLSWRTGIDVGAAREKVRVARALERLPRLSEAMRWRPLLFQGPSPHSGRHKGERTGADGLRTAWNGITCGKTRKGMAPSGPCGRAERGARAASRPLPVRPPGRERNVHRPWTARPRSRRAAPEGPRGGSGGALPEGEKTNPYPRAEQDPYRGAPEDPHRRTEEGNVPSEKTTADQRRADAIGLLAERALQGGLVDAGREPGDGGGEQHSRAGPTRFPGRAQRRRRGAPQIREAR